METPQQQRRPVIGQFAKTLAAAQLDCDAIDLADMLWLAQFIEPGAVPQVDNQLEEQSIPPPAVEIDNSSIDKGLDLYAAPRQTPSNVSHPQQQQEIAETDRVKQPQGTPFSVPAAPALRTRLDLARSLRPLMRRTRSRTRFELDEDATVTQIAETKVWMPMLKPRSERWLELDLVVESSKTTAIWERAIAELNHLVEYQGAFRSIRTWRLQESAGKIQLLPRWRDDSLQSPVPTASPQNQRPHTPGELIDPTGRRLIWLVTDCTSLLWRQEPIYQTLLEWSKIQPIAIVQMFSERLWSRTALRDGHIVKLSAYEPGVPSARLEVEDLPQRLARGSSQELVTVPIVSLEAVSMKSWARVTSGYGDIRTPGRTFELSFIRKQAAPRAGRERTSQRTARERIALFRSTASQTAQQLADLMAAAPVSLPVIDLLRDAFRGDFPTEVQQSHVAEVLLSGLLQRCDTAADKVCHYQFFGDDSSDPHERVRDLLLGDASISKTIKVLNVLSASIGLKLFGSPVKSFQALLDNLKTAATDRRDAAIPFARVGLDVLRRLGGEYAALARRYDPEPPSGNGKQSNNEFPPPLVDLEYEVAKLIEFPALQTCEYESATITAILDRFDFETAQVKRETRLLGLWSEWKIDRLRATTWGYTEILTSDSKAEIGLDMVAISGGSFLMGAPTSEPESLDRERPQHQVTLQPFYLGRYPITQAQWQEVATYPKIDRDLKPAPSTFTGDNLPVENVSWEDAQEFCQRLSAKTGNNYCLPSEAQWEYAARAGSTTPFHYGETIMPELGNYHTNKSYNGSPTAEKRGRTTEVGSFPANEWGLHDMHGNVWEWCEDDWHNNYHGAPTDGIAWVKSDRSNTTKLLRGGSWVNIPRNCRSAIRYDDTREYINYNVGVRVCCVPFLVA